jgi:cystathionine beta-lyase/cystathionine gamma-synthase
LQDLAAVAKIARAKKIVTICDNSYCTPLYQKPIELGIDLVLQSATKYINGHSDVVAGVLSGTKAMVKKIFSSEYMNMGIGTTPFNAWLLIRGLRTLQTRLSRISDTTEKVVNYLKSHEKVEGSGGLFSFYLKTNSIKKIEAFCENLQHIIMAVSWGGYESLIMPGCASVKEEDFDANKKEQRQLRMYVGLEDPQYIIEDLERGFKAMEE